MTEDARWERLEALFGQAVSLPPAERGPWLYRQCSDDPELRDQVAQLVAASDDAPEYLSRLASDLLGSDLDRLLERGPHLAEAPDPWVGRTVGHYELLGYVAGGGMGVVYRARDVRLERTVALKFLAPELSRNDEARHRFMNEAKAAVRKPT